MSDLQGQLGVATCCGCCADTAAEYLPGGRYAAQHALGERGYGALVAEAANDAHVATVSPMVEVVARRA